MIIAVRKRVGLKVSFFNRAIFCAASKIESYPPAARPAATAMINRRLASLDRQERGYRQIR